MGFPGLGSEFFCDNNPIYELWKLFGDDGYTDPTKIELFNDYDIIRDEDHDNPIIILDRLNTFLQEIGKPEVRSVKGYKCI